MTPWDGGGTDCVTVTVFIPFKYSDKLICKFARTSAERVVLSEKRRIIPLATLRRNFTESSKSNYNIGRVGRPGIPEQLGWLLRNGCPYRARSNAELSAGLALLPAQSRNARSISHF